jgi:hypothetical protein
VTFVIGFCVSAVLASPVFWKLGRFAFLDARVTHESSDVRPALRRSAR